MLTKLELCRMIVGLVEVNDGELLDQDAILSADVCTLDDRAAVRRIRDLMHVRTGNGLKTSGCDSHLSSS
jgi:hypothetical protein